MSFTDNHVAGGEKDNDPHEVVVRRSAIVRPALILIHAQIDVHLTDAKDQRERGAQSATGFPVKAGNGVTGLGIQNW